MSEIGTRAALIAACRAHRECNVVRGVFADFLDETGWEADAARARLIREQCAGINDSDAFAEYAKLSGWGLNPDAPEVGNFWRASRGFVVEVQHYAEWWLLHGDDLIREHDVQRVRLTTWPKQTVVRNPLGRVTHVALDHPERRLSVVEVGDATIAVSIGAFDELRRDTIERLLRLHWPSVAEWKLPQPVLTSATLRSLPLLREWSRFA